ncbi:MAG: hypothetical protein ACRDK4_01120, partial [Solirubrobacteraceae bacterium]
VKDPAVHGWAWVGGVLWGSRRVRFALNVALAVFAVATALTATGVFRRGASVGPQVPPSPTEGYGVAIPSSVKLLDVRVEDPGGGPPWGLRVLKTTRGMTCVQLGRIEFNTIGLLGKDGTFGNDGRFHPLSANAGADCVASDAQGNGFLNASLQSVPASANTGYGSGAVNVGDCVVTLQRYPQGYAQRLRIQHRRLPAPPHSGRRACPAGDLRDIEYGLLGPAAQSITYAKSGGKLLSTPTSGPEGAYLLIGPPTTITCTLYGASAGECSNGDTSSQQLDSGRITTVRYRDGHLCRLPAPEPQGTPAGTCPPYGYVTARFAPIDAARIAAPIGVKKIAARAYCNRAETIIACDARAPAGYKRLRGGPRSLLVEISFRAPVAIPDSHSYYQHLLTMPGSGACRAGDSFGGPTDSDFHAGQRVVIDELVPYGCPGRVHGSVSYVPPAGGSSRRTGALTVGRFSFVMP